MPSIALREALTSLNLFKSYSDDPETIRSERLKTRIYVVLFSLTLIAIIVYGAQALRTNIVTKYSPTEHEFELLSIRYPGTTRCPCSRVSIIFSELVQLDVTHHAVCSSHFISQAWIETTFNENVTRISPIDVRKTLSAFWQSIRSLCALVKAAVSDGFDDFRARSFISQEAQTREYLQTQARLNLNFSLETSLAKLQRNLLMIRQSVAGNRFISGLNTNYRIVIIKNRTTSSLVQPKPVVFPNGCSCLDPSGCPQHTFLFENHTSTHGTGVPGMIFNCQPFDGVLASSLECFYQSSCLSLLQQALSIPMKPIPLTSTGSRFSPNTTMQALVNNLMIEQLIDETLFTQYYSRCDPTYCIYSYSRRFDVLFIVTLVISAFGGISTIAKLVSRLLVKLFAVIRSRWGRRNIRSANTIPQISSPRK
jgi:hypothetical protein